MKFLRKIIILLIFSISFTIKAQDTEEASQKDEAAKDLIALLKYEDKFKASFDSILKIQTQVMEKNLKEGKITEDRKNILIAELDGIMKKMKKYLTWDKMQLIYVNIFKNHFTFDQLVEIHQFFASESGQAYNEKLPLIQLEVMKQTRNFTGQIARKIQEEAKKAQTK